jgi:hypothetical protein
MNNPQSLGESKGMPSQPDPKIVSTPRVWPKRLAFLILWALFLFGSQIEQLVDDKFGPPFTSYIGILTNRRNVLFLAAAVVMVVARFQPIGVVVQAFYLWLFIPIALIIAAIYIVFRSSRLFLRVPSITRGFLTSYRVHIFLWPLVILASVGILAGWEPRLLLVYLAIVFSSIVTLVADAFLFAFSPGAVHHATARLALWFWKNYRGSVEKQLASPEFTGDKSKVNAKVNELTAVASFAEKMIRYFDLAADRKTAIKLFIGILPFLFILVALLFAVVFLGLEHNGPGSFAGSASGPERLTPLDFFLFSVANMLNAGFSGVLPVAHAAKIVSMLEVFCSVSIVVVLLLIVTSISPERHQEELKEVLGELQGVAHELSQLIERVRNLNLDPQGSEP